jgi:hypothetical protein
MKRFIAPACVLFVLATVAVAGDVKSGLEDGASPAPFNVKDITGPRKGETLCYRCQYGGNPTAVIFTREITDEVAALVSQLDAKVGENKGKKACAFVVLLTEDADAGGKQLSKLAEEKKIKNVPLTIFDGLTGPADYKLSKDAAVTVLMWNKSRVAVNHGFEKGKLTKDDVKKVAGETDKILN